MCNIHEMNNLSFHIKCLCSKLRDKVTQSTLVTLCLANTNSTTPINHCRCH